LRRLIPNIVEIVKQITNILKKDSDIKCTYDAKKSIVTIKLSLTEHLVLISHDFSKDFLIISFAYEDAIDVVSLHKSKEGFEKPGASFSNVLRDAELKCNIMEK
jgi:hypothetical protein